jgi:hypothetical protein
MAPASDKVTRSQIADEVGQLLLISNAALTISEFRSQYPGARRRAICNAAMKIVGDIAILTPDS